MRSFLLRHDRRFGGKAAWTKIYWRWLSEQRFDFPHQQLAFEEMQKRVLEAQARVGRLEAALGEAVDAWRFAPLVRNLQVLRGIRLVSAATLVAEVGDLTRFDNPKQLMAYAKTSQAQVRSALGSVSENYDSRTKAGRQKEHPTGVTFCSLLWVGSRILTATNRPSRMTIHRTRITSDGRIQLPAQLRRELGFSAGDAVDLETQDGQFVVRRPSKGLERIRARLAKYIDPGTDLQSELKAQRVEDAQRG